MDLVACNAFLGGTKAVERERLTFRPGAYGLIIKDDKILLMNTIATSRYSLPGGGVELGETIEVGLKREIREETGLEVEVGRFLGFKEDFFYYDPTDEAFQGFLFHYLCRPLTFELANEDEIEDEAVDQPQWVAINSLSVEQFHMHGELTMELLQSL